MAFGFNDDRTKESFPVIPEVTPESLGLKILTYTETKTVEANKTGNYTLTFPEGITPDDVVVVSLDAAYKAAGTGASDQFETSSDGYPRYSFSPNQSNIWHVTLKVFSEVISQDITIRLRYIITN